MIDFGRPRTGSGSVERLNTIRIGQPTSLWSVADGERRYILANKGMVVGQQVMNGSEAPIKAGNACRSATSPWAPRFVVSR